MRIPHRVIVSDGGSRDGTTTLAHEMGATVLSAPRGRARQLNAGASVLGTPWLLFVHADSRLSSAALEATERHVNESEGPRPAHFGFRLGASGILPRLVELGQRIRQAVTGIPYGDQGLLLPRSVFDAVGGYPDVPLMEDVLMSRALRERAPLLALSADLLTSPRKYQQHGYLKRALANQFLMLRFGLGADPAELATAYQEPADAPEPTGSTALIVFAKAPREGTVKTRLARTMGDQQAVALYRAMGARTLDEAQKGPFSVTVCYAPDDGEPEMQEWLGAEVPLRPQGGGDLGARMDRMLTAGLEECDRAIVIGTDAPSVDRGVLLRASLALQDADVVIGPAHDGGYVLLGLSSPTPGLFTNIPWSTDQVLALTLTRAKELGLRVTLLESHGDVDTEDDLTDDVVALLNASTKEAPCT